MAPLIKCFPATVGPINSGSCEVRLRDEIANNGGLVWITAGREMENYPPPATLSAAVEKIAPFARRPSKAEDFDKALPSPKP